MAKVTIELYGILAIDAELVFEVDSVEEAVKATMNYLKKVKPELFHSEDKVKLQVVGYDTDEDLKVCPEDEAVLKIVPAVLVGKKAGFFQIVIGAVLIAASFIPGLQFLLPVGISMVIGGTLQLLAPTPTIDTLPDEVNPEASKYLSGSGNTTKHGTRIPLAGGTVVWYGHILSINIQARDLATGGSPTYANPDFGNGFFGSVRRMAWENAQEQQ